METTDRQLQLEAELDCRLIIHPDIVRWLERIEAADEVKSDIMKMFRFCYGIGYIDAFTEPKIASLYKDLNYKIPKRKAGVKKVIE